MINYQEFLNYLRELILLYKRQGSLRRKKDLAEKFHCVDISKDLFYQKGLHMMDPDSLTLEFAKQLRDEMSEAKKKANPSKKLTKQEASVEEKPAKFRAGQVITNGKDIFLIDYIVGDHLYIFFVLMLEPTSKEYIFQTPDIDLWAGNEHLKPASGPQVARMLGELRKNDYPYEIDQANGLFFAKRKVVDLFSGGLPEGYQPIKAIPQSNPSPYRFALQNLYEVRNAPEEMLECKEKESMMLRAIYNQIRFINHDAKSIQTYCEFKLPRLCCSGSWITCNHIGFVKDDKNRCYWLAPQGDTLRLLAWLAYI